MIKNFRIILFLIISASAYAAEQTSGDELLQQCRTQHMGNANITDCSANAAKTVRTRMNHLYDILVKNARAEAEEARGIGDHHYDGLESALKESQTAFLNYMDKECARASSKYGASSSAGGIIPVCKIRLMENRMNALNAVSPYVDE